jgi:solute carrier family 25 S-adenosylmethionine transporter 26
MISQNDYQLPIHNVRQKSTRQHRRALIGTTAAASSSSSATTTTRFCPELAFLDDEEDDDASVISSSSSFSTLQDAAHLPLLLSTVVPVMVDNRQLHSSYLVASPTTITTSVVSPITTTKSIPVHSRPPIPPGGGGGVAATDVSMSVRPLVFWENMICGAISRSVAQTIMHPANTMKTILQNSNTAISYRDLNFQRLSRGAGANLILSLPHGAVNFAVLEFVRKKLGNFVKSHERLAKNEERFGAGLDFLSSSISTITCSIVSTPQMMITDNIMAGNYPNLIGAINGLAKTYGIRGFYAGWWPGLVGKIPSYALTWTFFQQLKQARDRILGGTATDLENSVMGCLASTATVCLMIPMDTIKTRLVTQAGRAVADDAYRGIIDCAVRVFREEGIGAFYRGLPPRLISVVPMIGIQFGVYEFMKKAMLQRQVDIDAINAKKSEIFLEEPTPTSSLEEAMMETAASPEHPYPAPQFLKHIIKLDPVPEPKRRWGFIKQRNL